MFSLRIDGKSGEVIAKSSVQPAPALVSRIWFP